MIEVLVPLRNPGPVFQQTIDSLVAQSARDFRVLLSDNYSQEGADRIEDAARQLQASGLTARVIRPPWELGRVQHWNWLHHQSEAEWLKPLFVGDWLEPDCLAACREAMGQNPQVAFFCFYYRFHRGAESFLCDAAGLSGLLDPTAAAALALFHGNFAGAPVGVLYRRAAFEAAGGHLTSLPLMADFDLYTRLSLDVPTFVIPRMLGHFALHENRFAKRGSGLRRESMNAEWVIEAALIQYGATVAGRPIAAGRFLGRILRLTAIWLYERALRQLGAWRRALRPPE